jgi:raffinose/stachyose/melibiose transport system permease protein
VSAQTATSRTQVAMNYTLLIVCTLLAIYPLVGVVLASLYPPGRGSSPTGFAPPPTFAWHNYLDAWRQGGFASSFTTSIIVAIVMVPASVALSVVAGFAFATMRFRGSKVLFYLFILGLIIPTEATIVPLYYDIRWMGLLDTYWALILLEVSGELAFGIFWMRAAFLSAPPSLLEAARMDGASSWKTMWHILVPFAKPAILTLAVLTFADSWNEFFLALVFTVNHMTAPAGLASFSGKYTTNIPLVSAGAVIVAIPILIVFIFFQREFMRGMLTGAVKG